MIMFLSLYFLSLSFYLFIHLSLCPHLSIYIFDLSPKLRCDVSHAMHVSNALLRTQRYLLAPKPAFNCLRAYFLFLESSLNFVV